MRFCGLAVLVLALGPVLPAGAGEIREAVERLKAPNYAGTAMLNCRSDMKVCWNSVQQSDRTIVLDRRERFFSMTHGVIVAFGAVGYLQDSRSTLRNIGKTRLVREELAGGNYMEYTLEFYEMDPLVRPFVKNPVAFHAVWIPFHAGLDVASWKLRRVNGNGWGKVPKILGYVIPIGLAAAHVGLAVNNYKLARWFDQPGPAHRGP